MALNLGSIFGRIRLDTRSTKTAEREASGSFRAIDSAFGRMAANINAKGRAIETRLQSISRRADRLATSLDRAGGRLTARLTLPLTALSGVVLKVGSDLERFEKGLETVEGSADAAAKRIARLEQIARRPGLGFEQALRGFVRLRNVRIEAGLAERALGAVGNAIAIGGGRASDLDNATRALTQIATKGKVMGQEILQLAEVVPQIRQAMVDAFGTADTEALQNAGIDATTFLQAIVTELEKLPPALDANYNKLENTGISLRRLFGGIYDSFFKVFGVGSILDKGINIIDSLRARLEKLTETNPRLVRMGFIVGAVAIALGPLLVGLGSFISLINFAAAGLGTLAAIITGPVGIALAGLALLIYGIVTNAGGLRDSLNELAQAFGITLPEGINTATGMLSYFAGFLTSFASGVASWGVGIVTQIANGIVSAVSVVVQAINTVAGVIAHWLQPNSPPRALPDIDKWGRETAEVYLQGWTAANPAPYLRGFAGDVADTLRSFVDVGDLGEGEAARMLRGIQDLFAEAVAVGGSDDTIFDRINEAAGEAGDEVERLARAYVGLSSAENKVGSANARLNRVQKTIDDINKSFRRGGGRRLSLNQSLNLADTLKPLLREQELAQAELDAAQRAHNSARGRLNNQRASNQEANARRSPTEEIASVSAGIGNITTALDEALEAINKQVSGYQLQQAELRDIVRLAQLEAVLNDDNATAAQKKAAELEKQEIILRRQARALQAAELGIDLSELQDIALTHEDIHGKSLETVSALDEQMRIVQLQQQELADVRRLAEINNRLSEDGVSAEERKRLELEKQAILLRQQERDKEASKLGIGLASIRATPIEIEDILKSAKGSAATGISGINTELEGLGEFEFDDSSLTDAADDIAGKLAEINEAFQRGQEAGSAFWVGLQQEIQSAVAPLQNEIDMIRTAIGSVGQSLDQAADDATPTLNKWNRRMIFGLNAGAELIGAFAQPYLERGREIHEKYIVGWNSKVSANRDATIESVRKSWLAISEWYDRFKARGRVLLTNLILGWAARRLAWIGTVAAAIMEARDTVNGWVQKMYDSGAALIGGLIDGFKSRLQEFWNTVTGASSGAEAAFNNEAEINSPSRVSMRSGAFWAQGLGIGFSAELPNVLRMIANSARLFEDVSAVSRGAALALPAPQPTGSGFGRNLTISLAIDATGSDIGIAERAEAAGYAGVRRALEEIGLSADLIRLAA